MTVSEVNVDLRAIMYRRGFLPLNTWSQPVLKTAKPKTVYYFEDLMEVEFDVS